MTMESLVLDKLVELARNPTPAEMARFASRISGLERDNQRLEKERDDLRQAEAALTELWKAAKFLLESAPGPKQHDHKSRLRSAIKAAEPFIDQIPF